MANITRESIGLLTEKLTVTLEKSDYYPQFEKALKAYAKNANIKGFRKGEVPMPVVKKMYGSGVFTDELLRTVEKEVNGWMERERPAIFGQPLPTADNAETLRYANMNVPADFSFSFELGLLPQLVPANLSTATIKRKRVLATADMVQDELERMQTRFGNMREPDAVDGDDNVLNLTFKEIDAEGNLVEGGISKDNSLLVKYFAEAQRPQLNGLKVGDSINMVLSEAFEAKERDWMITDLGLAENPDAIDKRFALTITKIGQVDKRELDADFYEEVFPGKAIATEAEFRAALEADIQKQWDAQARTQVHDGIYHYLIDETPLELPEAFLKKWLMTSGEKPKTAEEVEQEFPTFKNSLHWSMITNALERQAQVRVEPEELRAFAKVQMMGYMGVNQLDETNAWLNDYVDRMLKDKKFVDENYNRLLTDKLFAWAETQVGQFEDVILSPDEFAEQQHNHQH